MKDMTMWHTKCPYCEGDVNKMKLFALIFSFKRKCTSCGDKTILKEHKFYKGIYILPLIFIIVKIINSYFENSFYKYSLMAISIVTLAFASRLVSIYFSEIDKFQDK